MSNEVDYFRAAADLQSELFFLGCFAANQENPFPEIAESDFSGSAYSRLYKAFQAGDFVPDQSNVAKYGIDREVWISVLESVGSSAQGEYHGRKIRHLAMRRKAIIKALHDLDVLSNPASDRDELEMVMGIDSTNARAMVKNAAQMWEEAKIQYAGMKTGFSCDIAHVRHVLGMSAPGDHIVIACSSSVGKTSLGIQICDHYKTLFVSGEMPAVNILRRTHAMEYWKAAETQDIGIMASESDQNREFHAVMRGDSHNGLFRDHWAYITDPVSLRELDAAINAAGNLEMVLVDYLQLMKGEDKQDRRNQMASYARGLKQLAKKHNVRIASLCQVSRPITNGAASDPAAVPVTLARLKESGDIEESADYVLGMWLHVSRESCVQALQDIKNRNSGVHPVGYLKRSGPWFRDADQMEVEAAETQFISKNAKGTTWAPE